MLPCLTLEPMVVARHVWRHSKALDDTILKRALKFLLKVKGQVQGKPKVTITGFRIIGRRDETIKGSEPKLGQNTSKC